MSITVRNIGLYLAPRKGLRTDYKLVLSLYFADHENGGVPDGSLPIFSVKRGVEDIDHEGFYVFDAPFPIVLSSGYYCISLHQEPDNLNDSNFFEVNFVEWLFDPDKENNKIVSSFSSDLQFTSDVYGYGYGGHGLGSLYTDALIYGYGYGYGDPFDPFDFFNVLEIDGDNTGYAIGKDSDFYGYGYGFENVTFATDDTIQRNFKIYENFNDIDFLGDNSVKVNLPPATESILSITNRQEFLFADLQGTSIVNNSLTLSDFGDRIITSNTGVLDSTCVTDNTLEWFEANFSFSGNDVVYADIVNPAGNTNQFGVYLVASSYYSGVFVSTNGGSTWSEKNTGLTLTDNSERNMSCVKFGPEGSYIVAFDNTNDTERGKVFKSTDLGDTWVELATTDLLGLTINDAFVVSANEIFVGTTDGVYRSLDGGENWTAENNGLPALTNVNQILIDLDVLPNYGYGYGGGAGISFFDVIGISASFFGYGFGAFEVDNMNSFEYGFGYEYGFSGGTSRIVAIATEFGAYWLVNGIWERFYPEAGNDPVNTNSVLFANNNIYVAKDDGIVRSEIVDMETETDQIRFRGHATKDALTGDFYVNGLLRRKSTKLRLVSGEENNIFVSQHGGIYLTQNDGGNFTNLTEPITDRPLKIKDILLNPVNNRVVFAIVETTKFASAGVTILMDCTGSMVANDPNEKRIDMALEIVNEIISAATETPYFQIIRYGASEATLISNRILYNSFRTANQDFDFTGAFNLTKDQRARLSDAGFSSNVTLVRRALDISCREPVSQTEHARTMFFDALAATSTGLKNFGARWTYKEREEGVNIYKYEFENISSNFYNNLDKSLIIITDGNDTVDGKTLQELISSTSDYKQISGNIYIVGVGHNINYENLDSLRDNNENAKLYLAPFEENLFESAGKNVSDIILDKERFRKRTGTWTKLIDLSEIKILKNAFVKANVPPSTTLTYKIRMSNDKKRFTDFTSDLSANTTNTIGLTGRYIEIVIEMTSDFTTFAPEVTRIDFTVLDPSESILAFPIISLENTDRIAEIEFCSLDDLSTGDISGDSIVTEFGLAQSSTSNFDFFNEIKRERRSVLLKRDFEKLTTEDGFFFTATNGPWPGDALIEIIDEEQFNSDPNTGRISSEEYSTIPSEGLVIFFNKIDSQRDLKLELSYPSRYRISSKIKNLDDTVDCFAFDDIAWTYYSDSLSETTRSALPKVQSQLEDLETFGILSPSNHPSSFGTFTNFLIQYIVSETLQSSVVSSTTGQRINLKLASGTEDNFVFYDQNTYITKPQTTSGSSPSFLRVQDGLGNDFGIVTITNTTDLNSLHYQVNVTSNNPIVSGSSIVYSIGDRTQGSSGISTDLFQSNLLFDSDDDIIGEFTTNFFIGDVSGTSTLPDIESAGDNGFDKIITPSANFTGTNATGLVLLAPVTVTAGGFFTIKMIATGEQGLIDRDFTGTVQFGFEDPNTGIFTDGFSVQFSLADAGVKELFAFVNSGVSGDFVVQAGIVENEEQASSSSFDPALFTEVFLSNTIIVDSTTVRFGDLNVSTIFSDGRQDIDFIADYASRVAKLDFAGIVDDLDALNQNEWAYSLERIEALTTGSLVLIPGFRHRSSDYYGERMVLFDTIDTAPDNINNVRKPSSTSSPETQISNLISDISSSTYISIPIRSPYETEQENELFRGRGFIFERYRSILEFNILSASVMESFVDEKETSVEIYSEHGNAENSNIYQSQNFIGSENNIFEDTAYVQHALLIGKRFGFTAGSGGFHSRCGYYKGDSSPKTNLPAGTVASNRGITAVFADTLNRTSIMSAIRQRKTYASTGARMFMSFSVSTQSRTGTIGDAILGLDYDPDGTASESATFTLRATADNSTITRIEIIRIKLDNIIQTVLDSRTETSPPFNKVDFGRDTGLLSFTDNFTVAGVPLSENVEAQEFCYYVRFTQNDGHIGWTSPIWLNYGRAEGIITSSETTLETVFQPSLSTSDTGVIENVPYSLNNTPPSGTSMPAEHVSEFFNPEEAERKTYSDKSVFVSEKNINLKGLRLIEPTNGNSVLYGTHYLKFIGSRSGNDYANEAIPDPDVNGVDENDENFKFLNDGSEDTLPDRPNFVKRHRSNFFGHMWQYLSSNSDFRVDNAFSFEGDENDNTIHVPDVTEKTKVIMKPAMIEENERFYLFYSSSLIEYPEDPLAGLDGQAGINPYKDDEGDTDPDLILSEETVGFSSLTDVGDWGENMRIHFARGVNSGSRETFEFNSDAILPNSVEGTPILFSHSPSIIKVGTSFKIYYLGYFGTPLKLTMFVHSFTDIEDPASGTTEVAFQFNGTASSFDSHNFTPYDVNDVLAGGYNNSTWPEDPYYGLLNNWLSVIQFDDGNYYAFFNFDNVGPKNSTNLLQSGTGILFSFNGTDFFETDPNDENNSLNTLTGIRYAHPFKTTISGEENWFMVYQNTADQVEYARINWTSSFLTNIIDS